MFSGLRRAVWPQVEPALADAGRDGELVVARLRLALVPLLLITPVVTLASHPEETSARLAILLIGAFSAFALVFLKQARHREPRTWLGFVTAATDVSFVTVYHAIMLASGFAAIALTNRAAFALYLLAITATSLRDDGRVAIMAGTAAGVEWLALVVWASWSGYTAAAPADARFYGDVLPAGRVDELVMIAATTALAQVVVRRSATLRLSAIRDGLTGLLNRSHFEERLASELLRSARYRRPLTVSLFDLDTLKRINDTFGHPAGDRVLCEVADRLSQSLRRTDLIARFGGDEFALLLADTEQADAAVKLEEIRRSVASRAIHVKDDHAITVTVSAGMAVAPVDGGDAARLIAIADARLLTAKQSGRDRLVAGSSAG